MFHCLLLIFQVVVASEWVEKDEVRLSTISVLLPYSDRVEYTVEGYGGSFCWAVSNPGIVEITSKGCGESVTIRVATQTASLSQQTRKSTFLIATHSQSKRELRCEIFVDTIDKIEIVTTTRTLHKDNTERLDIQGFDSSGNTFSNLIGLQFEWGIKPHSTSSGLLAKFVPFLASTVESSEILLEMESEQKRSSAILLLGVEVGKITVNAKMKESGKALAAFVHLSILEPLFLDPSIDVYLTEGAQFQYRLNTFKRERVEEILMPNENYRWDSENNTVAKTNQEGLISTFVLGRTVIEAKFVDMEDNKATGTVFVVEPASIKLLLSVVGSETGSGAMVSTTGATSDAWYLVRDRDYHLELQIYDIEDHKIILTPNVKSSFTLTQDHFDRTDKELVDHHADIFAKKEALTDVQARVGPLKTSQKVFIVSPVEIVTKTFTRGKLLLPPNHEFNLEAGGGSGDYNWPQLDSTAFVSIDDLSQLSRVSHVRSGSRLGSSTIRCKDHRIPFNFAEIEAAVHEPASVRFVEGLQEVLVGTTLDVFVSLFDAEGAPFDNCSAVPFVQPHFDSHSIFELQKTLSCHEVVCPPKACRGFRLLAKREGDEIIEVVSAAQLRVRIPLLAYRDLEVSHDIITLSLGSTVVLGVSGGPRSWPKHPRVFNERVIALREPSHLTIGASRSGSELGKPQRQYALTCLKLGEQSLVVVVDNGPLTPLVSLNKTVIFSCTQPHSLYIYPVLDDETAERQIPSDCVEAMHTALYNGYPISELRRDVLVRNERILTFKLVVFDRLRRSFHNFSTLDIPWTSIGTVNMFNILEREIASSWTNFEPSYPYFQDLSFTPRVGLAKLKIACVSYHESMLSAAGVRKVDTILFTPFSSVFDFHLYSPLRLVSKQTVLYLHADNEWHVSVVNGSGHFETSYNVSKSHLSSTSRLILTPTTAGVSFVSANDRCPPFDKVQTSVYVSDAYQIKLHVQDLVQVFEETRLEVVVLDRRHNPFPLDQYRFMSLETQVKDPVILSVKDAIQTDEDAHLPMQVRGLFPGTTSVTVYMKDRNQVSSGPAMIQVFPPFKLVPEKIYLLPSAFIQVQWVGGPSARSEVLFGLTDPSTSVAKINMRTGILKALEIGQAVVNASVECYSPWTENKFITTGDKVPVTVKYLKGIRIASSSSTLLVGNEMVVEVRGSDGESPFIWSGLEIEFTWTVQNSHYVQLEPLYKGSGVSIDEESALGVRLNALNAGRTTIHVKVTKAPKETRMLDMEAAFTLLTVDPLRLLSPSTILITPNTRYQIQTNYDHNPSKSLKYQMLTGIGETRAFEVSETGLITSFNVVGSAFIHISDALNSLIMKVTVKPIFHLSLSPQPPVLFLMAVGSSQRFEIVARDEEGTLFDKYEGVLFEQSLNLLNIVGTNFLNRNNSIREIVSGKSVSLNRDEAEETDLVHSYINVHALSPGIATLQLRTIGDENHKVTYFPIKVVNTLTPANAAVHVGATIKFETGFNTTLAYKKAWSSSDPSIVSINDHGIAVAHKSGFAHIYFNSTFHSQTTLNVLPIDKIESSDQQLVFSDGYLQVKVPILFLGLSSDSSQSHILVNSNDIDQNINYKCSALTDSSKIKVSEITIDGNFGCSFSISSQHASSIQNLKYRVTADGQSSDMQVSLVPMFVIEEKFKNIRFNEKQPAPFKVPVQWFLGEGEVVPKLHVKSTEQQLEIHLQSAESTNSFTVGLGSPSGDDGEYVSFVNTTVILSFPHTSQTAHILVTYEPNTREVETPSERIIQQNGISLYVIAILIIFGALLVLRVMVDTGPRPTILQAPVQVPHLQSPTPYNPVSHYPGTPYPHGPTTPFQQPGYGSPSYGQPGSPQNFDPFAPRQQNRLLPPRFTLNHENN